MVSVTCTLGWLCIMMAIIIFEYYSIKVISDACKLSEHGATNGVITMMC